jgi:hypothetical protein
MNQQSKPNQKDSKVLMEILTQNWLHIRHIENQRLQFTSIYTLLVAGILAFLGNFGFSGQAYLVGFLVIFSIFGLIVTLKVNLEFDNHLARIKKVIKDLHLEDYMATPTRYKGIGKIIRVRNVFILFYLILLLMWLYLLITKCF